MIESQWLCKKNIEGKKIVTLRVEGEIKKYKHTYTHKHAPLYVLYNTQKLKFFITMTVNKKKKKEQKMKQRLEKKNYQ